MCECSIGGKCSWVKEREDMARSTRFYNRSVRLQKEIAEHVKAAQQSVQADLLESCDCDRSSLHDCICPQCHARYIASR